MGLKVGIIDDEVHAIETLEYDLKDVFENDIDIVFTTTNPVEGIKLIKKHLPDILFLDVEMPGLSGIDVLELIDDLDLKVVVTTAHEEFAIKAVGTKAIAYLLKPIQVEQLQKLIRKCQEEKHSLPQRESLEDKLAVPVYDGIEIVEIEDIVYCRSESNYTSLIFKSGKKLVASKTLKYFTETLPADKFFRIHKSFLIQLSHILKYLKRDGGELVMVNGDVLPVSRNSREELLKLIQNNS